MFDDPKKELELLQEQLLQDEEWFEKELDAAKRMIGQMPEKKPRSAAAPRTPQAPQAPRVKPRAEIQEVPVRNYANGYGQGEPRIRELKLEEETPAPQPKKKSLKGLLILAALELLGIVGLVAYWAVVLL